MLKSSGEALTNYLHENFVYDREQAYAAIVIAVSAVVLLVNGYDDGLLPRDWYLLSSPDGPEHEVKAAALE